MPPKSNEPRFLQTPWAGAIAILAVTFSAYFPALRAGYIWDDDAYLTQNALVQSRNGLWKIWFTTETPQYYPLVFTSFWLEHKLWGLQPAGYHFINILLHALNAVLIWRLAARLRIPAAWFIGIVFALHPVHVESVAWITERKNVLSGLFYLLAFSAYLRFHDTRQWKWYGAAALSFIGALLSKTITATLPVAILLALFHLQKRLTRRDLLRIAPLLVVGAAMGLWTAHLERAKVGALGAEWSQTFFERTAIIAPSAFAFYAGKILWPAPLIFIYPRWEIHNAPWTAYLPLLGVLAAFAVALAGIRRWGWGPLLLLSFSAITLFPALGFLNVYPHRYSFVADHFQYLGGLGFIILYVVTLTAGVPLFREQWRKPAESPALEDDSQSSGTRKTPPFNPVFKTVGLAGAIVVPAVLGILTFRQCFLYENVVRLWEETLRANPNAWIAMINLGNEYLGQGRQAEAVNLFERALNYPIAQPDAYGCLGGAFYREGKYEEAIQMSRKALELRPRDEQMHANLGSVLQQVGRLDEAEQALQTALQIAPQYADAWKYLANLRLLQGRPSEAADCVAQILRTQPRRRDYLLLHGQLLLAARRYTEAAQSYETILAANPNDADALAGVRMVRTEQQKEQP